ncbi:Na(+)-translocating NADH-quinone reductase subunit F [Mesonia sp. MT50]|uniref:Na(+)-translocating NADH-quinone reductase subunit F n=1 Tax=Mesonia profundi TaxID=3070998 RepID=A0ABU1A1Z6_9FLAO|nr:Na(+)-translocating NADH-quinone reductase subunit F [Mesonia profundi]MDQ7917697.1 Na(+)-translocating NADH-quinone reductase subunit F [Mesonia profundi]
MKLPKRTEDALEKLYTAFHKGKLIPECHSQCAVGNICNNTTAWQHLTEHHGSGKLSYVGIVHERLGRKFFGFSPLELLHIEQEFLSGCGYALPLHYLRRKNQLHQDNLFEGLTKVVAYLCQLENIDNVMDCSLLFDYKIGESQVDESLQEA